MASHAVRRCVSSTGENGGVAGPPLAPTEQVVSAPVEAVETDEVVEAVEAVEAAEAVEVSELERRCKKENRFFLPSLVLLLVLPLPLGLRNRLV